MRRILMVGAGKTRAGGGFTMIELLVAIAIIAVLAIVFLLALLQQLARSRDAQRKADLEKIKISFEDYYNDRGCYPPATTLQTCQSTDFQPYLDRVPCDPQGDPYLYLPLGGDGCGGYRLLAPLEDKDDASIMRVGCSPETGCDLGPTYRDYNYGVSAGQPLNGGVPSQGGDDEDSDPIVDDQGPKYACSPGVVGVGGSSICNVYADPEAAGCPRIFSQATCQNACGNPANWCVN